MGTPDQHHLISLWQFGYRAGHSTSDALTYVSQWLANLPNKREEARVVCLDIGRSFDSIWHPDLLQKLSTLGFSGILHAWLRDFLKDRLLKVVLNGGESGVKRNNAEVHQGSILGPPPLHRLHLTRSEKAVHHVFRWWHHHLLR